MPAQARALTWQAGAGDTAEFLLRKAQGQLIKQKDFMQWTMSNLSSLIFLTPLLKV